MILVGKLSYMTCSPGSVCDFRQNTVGIYPLCPLHRQIGRRVHAPDPPNAWRRSRLRARRAARFPPHSKAVGSRFHPCAVASSQSMICSGVAGCWPSNARRFKMRCTDSVMLSQLPESGVYSGILPCAKSHSISSGVWWPARLSQISSNRSGGKWALKVMRTFSPSGPRSQRARFSSGLSTTGGGNVVSTAVSSSFSHVWSTSFVLRLVPLTRTRPVAGWNKVSSLAVPWRMYSWGWRAGCSSGSQLVPGEGTVWKGPASSCPQTASPKPSPSV